MPAPSSGCTAFEELADTPLQPTPSPMGEWKRHDAALYERIDRILWEDWDPIGVNDEPAAEGEYTSYVPAVFQMARRGSDARAIAEHLHSIARTAMGLGTDTPTCYVCDRTAVRICDAAREFAEAEKQDRGPGNRDDPRH